MGPWANKNGPIELFKLDRSSLREPQLTKVSSSVHLPDEPPSRPFFSSRKQMSVGRRIFLAVVLSELFTIVLIFGWYFYALRSEFDSITQQRAQDAVLQSITATEDYFIPAETTVEAAQLLLSDHILGLEKADQLERYFVGQLRLRPYVAGLYVGSP